MACWINNFKLVPKLDQNNYCVCAWIWKRWVHSPHAWIHERINCATCWSNIWTKLFTCWQKHLLFKRTSFIIRSSQLGKSTKCKLILSLSKLCPCISWNWTSLVGMYISLWLFTKIWMWWVGLWVAFGKLCIQKCNVGFISWCWVDLLKIVPKPHWLARWFLGLILITWCKSFCVRGSTIIHMSNNVAFKARRFNY